VSITTETELRPALLDGLADAIDGDATDRDGEEAGEAALSGTEGATGHA
jgi:hypothetical protein